MSQAQAKMSGENQVSFGAQAVADVAAACASGLALSPFITPIDAAVTESMSGKCTLLGSLKNSGAAMLKPHRYAMRPEFLIILGVYSATYGAKNLTETLCSKTNQSSEMTAFYKFWGVLGINGALCILWRDVQFAKIFGSKAPTNVPAMSYGLWLLRDVIHTTGSVVAPDYLQDAYGLSEDQWRQAQVAFPLLVQLFTSPVHLLGLDIYNNKDSTMVSRFGRIGRIYVPTVAIRMVRMFPPWSVGLVVNREVRNYFSQQLSSSADQ